MCDHINDTSGMLTTCTIFCICIWRVRNRCVRVCVCVAFWHKECRHSPGIAHYRAAESLFHHISMVYCLSAVNLTLNFTHLCARLRASVHNSRPNCTITHTHTRCVRHARTPRITSSHEPRCGGQSLRFRARALGRTVLVSCPRRCAERRTRIHCM